MGLIRIPRFRLSRATVRERPDTRPPEQHGAGSNAKREAVFEDVGQAAEAANEVQTEFANAQDVATTQASVVEGNITEEVGEHQQQGFQNAGQPVELQASETVSDADDAAAYSSMLSLITHRIGGYNDTDLAPEPLMQYAQDAFHVPTERHSDIVKELPKEEEKRCIPMLHVKLERASHLLDKDVSGTSDPYVILRVFGAKEEIKHKLRDKHSERHQAARSSVVPNSLDPEWNEEFTFEVLDPEMTILVADVWDYDPPARLKDSLSSAHRFKLTDLKDFKPCQYFKDTWQSLQHKDRDDFLGHSEVPVSAIPVEGVQMQLRLQPRSSRSSVRGSIDLKLWWTSKRADPSHKGPTPAEEVEQHRALLRRIVEHEAQPFSGDRSRAWPGTFSQQARHLLLQHELRIALTRLQELVTRFRVFSEYNVSERMNLVPLQRTLQQINALWPDSEDDTVLNPNEQEAFAAAVEHTIQACLEVTGRLFFDFKQDDAGQVAFATTILTLKTCFAAKAWRHVDDNRDRRLVDEIDAVLRKHLLQFYDSVLSEARHEEFYGSDVVEQVVAVKRLITTMAAARQLFSPALAPLGYDLFVVTVDVLDDPLAASCQSILAEWNKAHSTDNAMAGKFTIVFELYFALRKLLQGVYRHLPAEEHSKMNMPKMYEWFFPLLIRWMQLVGSNSDTWVDRALEYDDLMPIVEDAQYSSSVVDVFRVLNDLRQVWVNLDFPTDSDFFGPLLKMLADTLSDVAVKYVRKLLHLTRDKFQTTSRDEGFKISEPMCIVLNNAQEVSFKLEEFAEGMQKEAQKTVGVGEHVSNILDSRLDDCTVLLKRVCMATARCLEPELLRTMVLAVFESSLAQDASKGEDVTVEDMETAASELLDFINETLMTLVNGIYEETFQLFLQALWSVVCQCIIAILVPSDAELKSNHLDDLSATQSSLISLLLKTLEEFFHQDGQGLSKRHLHTEEFELATDLLDKMAWDTPQLIDAFFKEEQLSQDRQAWGEDENRGNMTCSIQFDASNNRLTISNIHLQGLPPMDNNGKCDPYLEVDTHPSLSPAKLRTGTKHKTLEAHFDDTLEFECTQETAQRDQHVLHFVAFDKDLLSWNDYIGECLLCLKDVATGDTMEFQRYLRRAPAKGKAWQILRLIQRRKRRDKAAAHFVKGRMALNAAH